MSKLGIIAPSNLVKFFRALEIEIIDSSGEERDSAVAITNAVSATPGSAPQFPILVHGGASFKGVNAWLRAMTQMRGYTAVILGGDPEQFQGAGTAKHIALPASMQDVFVELGPEFGGIAANNRFGSLIIGADFGITDATAAYSEESEYSELPEDLIPAPVSSENTAVPTWAQTAPPAQQFAPTTVPATVPVDADVPDWAQSAIPTAAPEPVAAPPAPTPALASETGAEGDFLSEPMPVLTAQDYEQTDGYTYVPEVQTPAQAPPPVGEPVYRPEQVIASEPSAPLTRREAAALAAQQTQQDVPAWSGAEQDVPAWSGAEQGTPAWDETPEWATSTAEDAPAAPAVEPFYPPSFAPAQPEPVPERKLTVFDPYSGGTTESPVHTYEQTPAPSPSAPSPFMNGPAFGAPSPSPIPVFNPNDPPSTREHLPVPVMPRPDADFGHAFPQAPAYTEPPAYTAPRMEPTPVPDGPRATIVASFAGKGGVTKTTSALVLAKKAAEARLRTVVIDMDKGQDNIAAYMRLRSASIPTIFDAVAAGRPEAALVTPDAYSKQRHEAAGRLDFAVVFGPGNEHASNHPSLTSDVYRQVIDYAAANADLVILDTQILKADRSASRLFYDVVAPLLVQEAWGVGITDQSRAGLEDLENRLKELQKNEGLTRERMLIMAANTTGFNQTQAESFARRFRSYGDFIGATSADDAFKSLLNVGRIDSDSPAVSATMDAILHRVTGNEAFAPKPVKKRRGFFGRG